MQFRSVFLILIFIISGWSATAQHSLMTWNIRFNNPHDGDNWWEHRKAEVADLILKYEPGIFGTQEGLYGQLEYLDSALKDYQYVGVGRDDGKTKGEYTAIFYDVNTYKLIDNHTYWLSETPEKPSVGWDAAMERITTYAAFVHIASGDTLHVFNCHYDHIGQEARMNASRLMLELLKERKLTGKAVVVMGDFNAEPGEMPVRILVKELQDAYAITETAPLGPVGTFNGFDVQQEPTRRIDYIFTQNLKVNKYQCLADRRANGLSPSDHLPVLAVLTR